jgi:hypothetical protein
MEGQGLRGMLKDAPPSLFWNGPAVKVIPSLDRTLLELQ